MADSEQTIIGGKQLHDFLQGLPVKVERNILRAALRAGAAVIREEARNNVPVKDGNLRKSIRVTTGSKKGMVWATVKAGSYLAPHWRWVEYGTKPHLISVNEGERPINWKRTQRLKRLSYLSMKTINRHVLQIGNHFVGPTVNHPGATPKPFMRPALDAAGNRAVEAVTAKIRERLTKEGINLPPREGE